MIKRASITPPFQRKGEEREAFIEWLCTPPSEREIPTQKALAAALNVEQRTLYNWSIEPEMMAEARRRVAKALHGATPQVLNVIKEKALAGDYKFVTLFLSLVGEAGVVAGANAREIVHTMSVEEATRIMARVTSGGEIPAVASQSTAYTQTDTDRQDNNTHTPTQQQTKE